MSINKLPIRAVLIHYGAGDFPHRRGWAKVKCILHDESQASASVNEEAGLYKCFACMQTSPIGNGSSTTLDGLDIVAIKEGCSDFACADECAERIFGESVRDVLSGAQGKPSRRVFGESRPKRGQRNAFQARVRRRTFGGS